MELQNLVYQAFEAQKRAYTPYSKFNVGAALLCQNGKVYQGANIENAAYGPSNCAERTAFFKAVYEGERSFTAIAICGAPEGAEGDYCYPCGVCRQVMAEFCDPEQFIILIAKNRDEYRQYLLKELLPHGFGPGDLKNASV